MPTKYPKHVQHMSNTCLKPWQYRTSLNNCLFPSSTSSPNIRKYIEYYQYLKLIEIPIGAITELKESDCMVSTYVHVPVPTIPVICQKVSTHFRHQQKPHKFLYGQSKTSLYLASFLSSFRLSSVVTIWHVCLLNIGMTW